MADQKRLSEQDITKAFTLMGELLARKKKTGEIAIYGGTAVMLQLEYRENTNDVDCVVKAGHGDVMQASIQAGFKLGLPSSWLNENVSIYASRVETESDFGFLGVYPSASRPALKVRMARPEYLLAMKIEALSRGQDRDKLDAAMLIRDLGLNSVDEVIAVRERYFGEREMKFAVKMAVKDLVDKAGIENDVAATPKKPG